MVQDDLFVNLVTDRSRNSILARKYLEDSGISFKEIDKSTFGKVDMPHTLLFGAYFGKRDLPFIISGDLSGDWGYYSLSGVKAYIRRKISEDLFKDEFGLKPKRFWKDITTYFPNDNSVTYFDENGNNIFEGNFDETHIDIKSKLEKHPYKDWHHVSCWRVGKLEELAQKQTEQGFIFDEPTQTILFPDDLDILRKEKDVVTIDSKSMMNVTYEAYFMTPVGWEVEDEVFGIYAHMQD